MKIKCPKCKETYDTRPFEIRNDELCAHCVTELPPKEERAIMEEFQPSDIGKCPLCNKQVNRMSKVSLYGHRLCQFCRSNFAIRRQAAFLIDWVLIYLFSIMLMSSPNDFLHLIGVMVLSLFLIKDGFKGYSLGKAILGLQVINEEDGKPIGLLRSCKRNLPTLLPIPLYRFFLGFQLLEGYRNGDGWAQTKVIWKKFSSHFIFQPKCSSSFVWTEEIMQLEGERRLSFALKKEIKGDWDEAIRLYNQIIKDFPEAEIANDAKVSLKSLKERIESNC